MMTKQTRELTPVQQHITRRFFNLYGAPAAPDFDGYLAEYERALGGTDPALLSAAADLAIDQHTYPTWPTIGEVKKAIEIVAIRRSRERDLQKLREEAKEPPRQPHSDESKARVDALMRETVGKLNISGPPPPARRKKEKPDDQA